MKLCTGFFLFFMVVSTANCGMVYYEYDEAGRLTGVRYEQSSRASYIYDPMGNLVCSGDTCDIYVENLKICGGKKPCYSLINQGVRASGTGANLKISSDLPFSENVSISREANLVMQGGWVSDFSARAGLSTIEGSLTLEKGTVTIDCISITNSASP